MDNGAEKEAQRRVIKRYSNRKLYDTRDSRYVTLLQIAEMVRAGEDVQIIDNTTKEDKTEVTLALAISEELKTKPRAVPLGSLRTLIQEQGEKLLTSLREGAIGRLIPTPSGDKEGAAEEAGAEPAVETTAEATSAPHHRPGLADIVASSRQTFEEWQHTIDERIRTVIPGLAELMTMPAEMRRLAQRVEALEARLGAEPPVIGVEESPSSAPGDNSAAAPLPSSGSVEAARGDSVPS